MGKTSNGALSGVEAAWALAQRLETEALTLEEAAQIVAGCNGDKGPWYAMSEKRRAHLRSRTHRVLVAGVERGTIRESAIGNADGGTTAIWEATHLSEIPY